MANCPPPVVRPQAAQGPPAQPLTEAHVYSSPALGFSVQYGTPPWTAGVLKPALVALDLFHGNGGWFHFEAVRGAPPLQLVAEVPNALTSTSIPDIRPDHVIRGAHVGAVPGAGEVYAATLVPQGGGGQAIAIRIPVVAAEENGLSVIGYGIAAYDHTVNGGVAAGDAFDYLLTEFGWPGQ